MTRQAQLIIVSLLAGLSCAAAQADDATPAAKVASSTAAPAAVVPAIAPPSPSPASPAPAAPATPPAAPRPNMNEMRGKFQSSSDDDKTLRVTVDGGFNVGFTYDKNTSWLSGGSPIQVEDLNYGDELIVRYSGRDLYAVEVERVNKAP